MLNKYGKYIYSLIIFYVIWLAGIPLAFRLFAVPILNNIKCVQVTKPRLYTSILPNIKLRANEIILFNKDGSEALNIQGLKLNLRLLPLLSGRIHINSFEEKSMEMTLDIKDKLYLGDYPIDINPDQEIKGKVNRIKIEKAKVSLGRYSVKGEDLYFKTKRKAFIAHGKTVSEFCGQYSWADFDINLPNSKNLKKTKFNIAVTNLNLNPYSDFIHNCVYKEIDSLNGVINIHSDNQSMIAHLDGIKVNFTDKNKSLIFPEKFIVSSKYQIKKNSVKIRALKASGDGIKAKLKGEISDIFSKKPGVNIAVTLDKSDIRKGALLLPPIVTEDISIPKLKEYPFYGNIWGNLKIKGKIPEPDITGNIKVSDGVLIDPIPNATGGANVNIDFKGKQLVLDVVVPAGGREVVYVSGDVMIYNDRYAHLRVRSSKNVDLSTAERVVNPLHEILCFVVGPVPIMDVNGHGNIDIKIEGTKKDPHIWGDFNFVDTSARFLEVNNMTLVHADGNLNFNNQNAHFINNTGTLHGEPVTIDGTCTLFGDLDFDVTANKQNLNDLYTILTTSPMLKDIKEILPVLTNIKGKSDFNLNLRGKLLDINALKINENVIPKGSVKLMNDSVAIEGVPVNGINGIINFNKTDCDFDLDAMISSASKSTIKGGIKNNIADVKIDSPRIRVNELNPDKLRYLDPLTIKFNAHYKGDINKIDLGGIDSDIEVIRNNSPVKHGKIASGKITIKNNNLNISNLYGIIKNNPFSVNLRASNINDPKHARVNGDFNCRELDLTVLNLITKANVLPNDIQKELKKVHFVSGKASIAGKARNSRIDGNINIHETHFEYNVGHDNIPTTIMSGQIGIKNNNIIFNKFNCLVDNMPVLLYGQINNYFSNPQYNLHINSKLVQKVFDKYWNANNIYPIKIYGDILSSTNIDGNKNHTHIKSDMKMQPNSGIYYMGATIGDSLNPITVNIDSNIDKSGVIKINKFKYNKLISSQNNKENSLPVLSINGQLKKIGKIYELKNLTVKTDNPANATFFNIIFKKPTIKQGNFTSNIVINGTSDKPKIIGTFNANNMEMPYLNTSIKNLDIDFKPDNIRITTRGEVLENYMMLNANIKNNLNPPYRINSADIYINDFDIDHSVSQIKQMELKGFSSAIAPDADVAGNEIINSLIFNNVKIRAGIVRIKNIKASNLEAVCSLNDRMQMSVDKFFFNMASGTITGNIKLNILNNFMQMQLDAKNVNANDMTTALFDLPNQIYGSLTGHIDFSCNATNDKTRLQTLSGYGTFHVSKGRMPKLGSLEYLLRAGNLIKGGITGLSMNGLIDIVTPMKTGEFKSINGRIRLKDGIAKTVEITTLGKNLNLYVIGSINLYNQIADMHVFGQLSKTVSTVLGAAGNISLNTLFNKIPGISLDKNSPLINDLNKIPGIELTNKLNRKFMVEILGDVNSENFVKSFKWIN